MKNKKTKIGISSRIRILLYERFWIWSKKKTVFCGGEVLKDVYNRQPRNAKYVSPDIQNEIIAIMTKLVKNNIASKVRMVGLFTIIADGTSDKNRKGNSRPCTSILVKNKWKSRRTLLWD